MVRRLSIASRDSGTESSVYAEEPAKQPWRAVALGPVPGTDKNGPPAFGAPPCASGGGPIVSGHPAKLPAPAVARLSSVSVGTPHPVAPSSPARQSPIGLPPGATRDITVTASRTLPGQVGRGLPRLATTYDMSVFDPKSARW